ncbi:MAG: tldD [Gammaproteobacteria bacterium]|jgi:TldD protein|nr:tldD [Gammaproteobacteria bacterium]
MLKSIDIARHALLEPAGLSLNQVSQILQRILGNAIDSADIYFQVSETSSWSLEDSIIKRGTYALNKGVGVRAIAGEKTGFAYSDDILLTALTDAADAAKSIARQGQQGELQVAPAKMIVPRYETINPVSSVEDIDNIRLLQKMDALARSLDKRVKRVTASIGSEYEIIYLMQSDGTIAGDVRPLVRLNVSVIMEEAGRFEQGYAGGGGRYSVKELMESGLAEKLTREAVRTGSVNLEATASPAGMMTVVLGPGWPGILLHEAIGHGLEGDFNRKGTSAFSGRIGERVAAKGCTVVDDGTLEKRRGSLTIDDEGTPSQCTTLIEDGILKNYMQDKLNAKLMGMAPTGNGRRESYAHVPMPRMTNTYMLAGQYAPEEIIASVEKGLYAVNFGGGQVDITSGQFVFSASEAYLIENGRITRPVKGATLIGSGPEVLTRVSMIGNDLKLDEGVGTCGKEGQSVPVGVGQPTLKIDGITVGGTERS